MGSPDSDAHGKGVRDKVTRWAVLIAGSKDYSNYRHQADVCHAYQVLRKGGVKKEHIVVFMYDDIANNPLNPRPGVIINNPQGKDVYAGVPKYYLDYTGDQVTTHNLFAVLSGNKTAVIGGSGKVIDSKPQDHIFIFYSDHGSPGVLSMPNPPYLYAGDFVEELRRKHASHGYSKMVIYVDACESGSIFEGLLPKDLSICASTASNGTGCNRATYCAPPPAEYQICLGDLFSVSWIAESETHNPKIETLGDQLEAVSFRFYSGCQNGVMVYGDKTFMDDKLFCYQGDDPANVNTANRLLWPDLKAAVYQRHADVLFMWKRYEQLNVGSEEKLKALREIKETLVHREHLDSSIDFIGKLVFGFANGPSVLEAARSSGQPLVDDWDCLKTMVRIFESRCGSLTHYGMKHTRAFANKCNNGVYEAKMKEASISACSSYDSTMWSPVTIGYSA